MKWYDFLTGDVIASIAEIDKLKKGNAKEGELEKFIVNHGSLCTFPDLTPIATKTTHSVYNKIAFEKLFTVLME